MPQIAAAAAPMAIHYFMNRHKPDPQKQAMTAMNGVNQKQSGLADAASRFAGGQTSLAAPAMSKAMQYYSSLAGGNASDLNAAVAPDMAQLTDTYKGAESGINARMGAGPQRDQAIAELMRQRAGQVGMTKLNARSGAFGQLAGLGQQANQNALGGYGIAGNTLGNLGYQYGNLQNNLFNQKQTSNQNAMDLGSLFGKIIGSGMKQDSSSGNGFNWKNY